MDKNLEIALKHNLLELSTDLYNSTAKVYYEFSKNINYSKIHNLKFFEMYTSFAMLKTFFMCHPQMEHYEFSSLLSFWKKFYNEITDNNIDSNSVVNEFENYADQNNLVIKMLKNSI